MKPSEILLVIMIAFRCSADFSERAFRLDALLRRLFEAMDHPETGPDVKDYLLTERPELWVMMPSQNKIGIVLAGADSYAVYNMECPFSVEENEKVRFIAYSTSSKGDYGVDCFVIRGKVAQSKPAPHDSEFDEEFERLIGSISDRNGTDSDVDDDDDDDEGIGARTLDLETGTWDPNVVGFRDNNLEEDVPDNKASEEGVVPAETLKNPEETGTTAEISPKEDVSKEPVSSSAYKAQFDAILVLFIITVLAVVITIGVYCYKKRKNSQKRMYNVSYEQSVAEQSQRIGGNAAAERQYGTTTPGK